jgi:DNA-binding protein H-NS
MEFNSLDARQLKQFISNASSALNRRQKIEKAIAEIQRVSKKYKLNKEELKIVLASVQPFKAASSSKHKTERAKVAPKYQSQDGAKKWTGRGRAPSWVVEICRSTGLTLEEFKAEPQFLIGNSIPSKMAVDQT